MLNLKSLFQNMQSEVYSKTFHKDSSSKVLTEESARQRLSWRFCISLTRNWQRKKKIVSISAPQLRMELTQSLNLWRNLCLLQRLNFSCSLISNFTLIWSYIENKDLCFNVKSFNKHWLELLNRFSFAYGVSKVAQFPNTKRKERIFVAFCSVRKFL